MHDWLTGFRGGEKVLAELAKLYPEADLYTLVYVPGSTCEAIERLSIHTSPLSRIPGIRHHYRAWLPLFPLAIRSFRLEGYDLIVSVSHAVAKAVPHDAAIPHVSYCLTPMRYVWDESSRYLGHGLRRTLSAPLVRYLKNFDRSTSDRDQVRRFVAVSRAVSVRISDHYQRFSEIVWPPVDVDRIRPNGRAPDDFYLLVGGFVPYKCAPLAIEAFRELKRPLWIVGDGPLRRRLASGAPAHVRFLGHVGDAELADLYARCRALIYPQREDFGISAVEAQAAGRPVIAFGGGGACDTVVPLDASGTPSAASPTGIWFTPHTSAALAEAVLRFEANEATFSSDAIRAWAKPFGPERFRREFSAQVQKACAGDG